jgi:hypothetical protein
MSELGAEAKETLEHFRQFSLVAELKARPRRFPSYSK